MGFIIPTKDIIVNDDSQVRLLDEAGVAFDGSSNSAPSGSGGFILEGFLGKVLSSQLQLLTTATRIRKTTYSAGVAEIAGYTITAASGGKKGDCFRLVFESLDMTPTEFQSQPVEKIYQLGSNTTDAPTTVVALVASINADKYSPVTAYAGHNNAATPTQNDSAKIVLVAKKVGLNIDLYVGEYSVQDQTTYTIALAKAAAGVTIYHTVEDTNAVTVAASLPVNTYDYLKNINWSKNFEIDRNLNWMPLPGVNYESYYFEVNGAVQDTVGSSPIPSQVNNDVRYGVKIWVKNGLALETALDALVTDVNV
jgi:hypothetical protein